MSARAEAWKRAEARRAAREKVRQVREELRAARKAKRERLAGIKAQCKAGLRDITRRARQERAELIAEQREERASLRARIKGNLQNARGACSTDRAALLAHVAALRDRLTFVRRERQWTLDELKRGRHRMPTGMTLGEQRAHERDMVLRDIEGEAERALFLALVAKGKLKSSARRSLGESWIEWVHDHPAQVSEARHARELADLNRLEHEERAAWEETQRTRRKRRPVVIASVEGASDAWGGF